MQSSSSAAVREVALLTAAGTGDRDAFSTLVEPARAGLLAHCYRMLGSTQDAEDALQEALLRAWRAAGKFEGRSSVTTWLYSIATNSCLTVIDRRRRCPAPVDHRTAASPHGASALLPNDRWIEPFPDEDCAALPEGRYDELESVELAFIVAIQHLTPRQRAVLILCDVLSFSAREAAETLGTTTASVTSALQRARRATEERLPERSQQETLRSLGDRRLTELVEAYVDAWQSQDVGAVIAMLTQDVTFAMPPLATFFSGREAIAAFLKDGPLSGQWRWRALRARANGQEALGFYVWDPGESVYLPFALNVLTLRGSLVSGVTAFLTRSPATVDAEMLDRLPEAPTDPALLRMSFGQMGLPAHVG
jgi:RNA polymerase sigma-70 factor (ECF subfamily)